MTVMTPLARLLRLRSASSLRSSPKTWFARLNLSADLRLSTVNTTKIQEAEINEQLLKSAEDIFGNFLPLSRLETANDATNEIIESEVDE